MRINRRLITLGLTLLGVVGVGVTSVVSIRCHDKVKDEPDKRKKILGYVPAIASGVATGACILGSHYISAKDIAALSATCAYLAKNRDKIEAKVREKYGENAAKELKSETVIHSTPVVEQSSKGGDVKFVEYYLGREFYSTIEAVEDAERKVNWMIHNGEDVCMNDFYRMLGLRYIGAGNDFNWTACDEELGPYPSDGPIIFENIQGEDEDGRLMYIIDIRKVPTNSWFEEAADGKALQLGETEVSVSLRRY